MKTIIVLLAVLVMCGGLTAATNHIYLEFETQSMAQLEQRIQELETMGVEVVHIFPPDAVITRSPEALLSDEIAANCRFIARPDRLDVLDSRDAGNQLALAAWKNIIAVVRPGDEYAGVIGSPLNDCVRRYTRSALEGDMPGLRAPLISNSNMFVANYLVGRVAVRVVLMESTGSAENWQPNQGTNTVAEIVQGLDYLSDRAADRDTKLQFVYEVFPAVPTDEEPIQGPSVPYYQLPGWKFGWIDDALSHLGFDREWDGVFAMANHIRRANAADWGYSIFVVMDESDPDHRFSDSLFAYVKAYQEYAGDPWNASFVVMTYNNADWGIARMSEVLMHESSHIFRAPDEYEWDEDRETGCPDGDCSHSYGYLHVVNGNCLTCNDDAVPCLMRSRPGWWDYCDYSIGHVGWRDGDVDGVADAIKLNSGGWQTVSGVTPGDLIRIYTLDGDFVNLISVTSDKCRGNAVIWDGHNFDGQTAALSQVYLRTINAGSPATMALNPSNPSIKPVIQNLSYAAGQLSFQLKTSWAYLRCFIFDKYNRIVLRPLWDEFHGANESFSIRLSALTSDTGYTAKVFGWRPDGGISQTNQLRFDHSCSWVPGDADDNATWSISDAVYLINYIFAGGPVPTPHPRGSGDADCSSQVSISDAVYLINYIFAGGPQPAATCDCRDYI